MILDRLIFEAEAGKSWAIGMVLDRILPASRRDEVELAAQCVHGPHIEGRIRTSALRPAGDHVPQRVGPGVRVLSRWDDE